MDQNKSNAAEVIPFTATPQNERRHGEIIRTAAAISDAAEHDPDGAELRELHARLGGLLE